MRLAQTVFFLLVAVLELPELQEFATEAVELGLDCNWWKCIREKSWKSHCRLIKA